MIQCITFDLDDTLWDVRPALQKAEQAQNAWLDEHYPAARAG
ncbi:MAG: HAD family hydrolase, partial [Proteobacteria bacterium]|nr:HAD family hydrolase [Pseudomonadota bacterium]